MAIELNTPNTAVRHPVLKHEVIGELFVGMLVDAPTSRDILKRNPATGADEPVLKPNGKPRQELVVKLMALPGCTMTAKLGDQAEVPQPGAIVRSILKGKAYGAWIDADKATPGRQVGDVIALNTTHGQAYDHNGNLSGAPLATNEEINALPRGMTVGKYGDLAIRRALPEEAEYVRQAEAAHMAERASIPLESPTEAPAPVANPFGAPAAPVAAPAGSPFGNPAVAAPVAPPMAPIATPFPQAG